MIFMNKYMEYLEDCELYNFDASTDFSLDEIGNLTPQEIEECDSKVKIVEEIIKARRSKKITQQALEELSGVRQPVIARLEKNISDPQLTTVFKLLRPLGKTLAVIDIPGVKQEDNWYLDHI